MEGIDVASLSGVYSGEPSLGEQLAAMAVPTREEAKKAPQQEEKKKEPTKLEISLVANFIKLGEKFNDIHDSISKRNNAIEDSTESENDLLSELNRTVSLFEIRNLLEKKIFTILLERLKEPFDIPIPEGVKAVAPPKVEDTPDPWENTNDEESVVPVSSDPAPTQLAEGGITTPADDSISMIPSRIVEEKMAETLQLPLPAAAAAGLSIVNNFLSSLGPLAIALKPEIKSFTSYASALGLSKDIAVSSLGGSILGSISDMNQLQKEFGKTWAAILGDNDFINQFIDRESDDSDPNDPNKPQGFVPAKWEEDPEFVEALNEMCERLGISAPGMLAIMARESGIRPDAENSETGAVGLIQLNPVFKVPESVGTTATALKKMTRKEQLPYIEKYLTSRGVKSGMTPGDIYAIVFVPGFARESNHLPIGSVERGEAVLTDSSQVEYKRNAKLDDNQDGNITRNDLTEQLKKTAQSFKIQGFEKGGGVGSVSKPLSPLDPYIVEGSPSGYPFTVYDLSGKSYNIELHGRELVAPSLSGFKVLPIENKKYSIEKDPKEVSKRWQQIAGGSNETTIDTSPQESYIPKPVATVEKGASFFNKQNPSVEPAPPPTIKENRNNQMEVIREQIIKDRSHIKLFEPPEINKRKQEAPSSKIIIVQMPSPSSSSTSVVSQQSPTISPTLIPVEIFDPLKYSRELSLLR